MALGSSKIFCPKCESEDVEHIFSEKNQFGYGNVDMKRCRKCGYEGTFFPTKG